MAEALFSLCRAVGEDVFIFLRRECCPYQQTPPIVNIKERRIIPEAVIHFLMFITHSFFNDAPSRSSLACESSLFVEKFQILPVALLFQVLFGNESQCRGVHAIPKPCRRWPVIKHMAEMGIACLLLTSVRFIKKPLSSFSTILPGSRGLVKLGHPVPESNLSTELNRGSPETIST